MKKFIFATLTTLLLSLTGATAAVKLNQTQGWFESAYVTWTPQAGTNYAVYVAPAQSNNWTELDKELLRSYGSYFRADALGLKAGSYQFKVVPVIDGEEADAEATISEAVTVKAHDRSGFAHYNNPDGVGAYKNDGTLKDNARILYVWADNAKTISLDMKVDSKGKVETRTGLQNIIQAYEKSYENRPLAIRIIGCINAANMDTFGSSAEGLQVKGKSSSYNANLTIEGVGNDATIQGFGILCRSIASVEFRNFAIMICMDDCLSLDTDNKRVWIHNMDFFYGGTGGDADQAKGDGTVDIKGQSSHVTVSYNHFFDSGKCSLGGMKSETTDCWMTYHHNWFDHSDSRHPRIRTAFYHVYNNYFDGNAKYGVGVTCGGSAFVESNNFRNCKYPMLISKQGTDAQGDGTFSGEPGGVIKAYNNVTRNPRKLAYYDGKQTDGAWDAVRVDSRDAVVTAMAFDGGTEYNATATAEAIKAVPASVIDEPANIPTIVRSDFGAGRIDHGDFDWKFKNSVQDANYAVIAELKQALLNYKSTLVGFADGTTILNGGASKTVVGGDGQGISIEDNEKFVPEWGSSGDDPQEEPDFEEEPFIASADDDIFWFGENLSAKEQYETNGNIVMTPEKTSWNKDFYTSTTSQGVTYTSEHVGAYTLTKASVAKTYDGGSLVFYCPNGVTTFKLNMLRTGTGIYRIEKSADGVTYETVATVEDQKAGVITRDFSREVRDAESKAPVWVRLTNGSTGTLYVFGVLIRQLAGDVTILDPCDLTALKTSVSINIGQNYTLTAGVDYQTTSTGAVSFAVNDRTVASLSENVITGVAEGSATITIAVAKSDKMKAGSVTMTLNVTDPRSASSLALTSDANVTLKEGNTSQITTSGAAGALTYQSSNTAVATVTAEGVISAVAAGSTTITVSDAGSDTVRPGSVSVNVSVTKDMTGKVLVTFTYNGKTLTCSDPSLVALKTANGKNGLSVSYNGETLTDGAKMESATLIHLTPSADATITLVFDLGGKRLKLQGPTDASPVTVTNGTDGTHTFSAVGGKTYALTKGDSMNLVAVLFDFGTTGIEAIHCDAADLLGRCGAYDLMGRPIQTPAAGQFLILNGQKSLVR